MNFRRWLPGTGIVLGLWLCAAVSTHAQTKLIRLRNEQITTTPPDRTQIFRTAQDPPPVSGLFLIQFTEKFNPAWREELLARKVELVRYVPDDAFVARLNEVRLDDVRALPFVQWVGEFRPEHKVQGGLRQALQAVNARSTGVTVLFSPSATPAELLEARLRLEGVKQESKHRFGTVLRGKLAPGQLQRLAQSPAVLWIEPAPRMKLNDEISSKIIGGDSSGHSTFTQSINFDGRGYPELDIPPVTVAVADTGLHIGQSAGMHPDLAGRTPVFLYYGDELTDASDEHGHGTHVAGIIAGNGALGTTDELGYLYGLGVASGAAIVTQRIFDGDGNFTFTGPFDTFDRLTSDALQAGAVIGNNSWGDDTQGRYDVSAAEFDALVRDGNPSVDGDQPYILEFSAGNAGPVPQTIGSPAVAKNVIATGAAQSDRPDFDSYVDGPEAMADFSSRGPCEDGRIKPDVVAPGTWIASLQSPLAGDVNGWPVSIDADYLYMGGTSQAGPHVAGAAAVFVQYYRDSYGIGIPSPALVKAALIHSAVDMDDSFGTGPTPNMDEGWGRVDLTEIIYNSYRTQEYLDQTVLLKMRQTYERSVIVASTNEPLKITLVYTDVPGFPAAIPALVNDLDLEVVAPDGRVYRGNQFEGGESVPDARGSDNINNVEGIYIRVPLSGEYIVRVRATNVVLDARIDTIDADQDFALVVSGDLRSLETEAGIVLLDRGSYTAPSQIKIKLFDLDLAAVPSVNVTVRSQSQPTGLPVALRPLNPSGVFTGAVATVTSTTAGKLRIAHGDWIRAEYFDVSSQVTNVANAVADLVPPFISAVSVTNQFNQMVVTWTTDEPATSIVRFGTNATLNRAVTNTVLTTTHEIELGPLVAGQTYSYAVISADAAGNVSSNSGGGTFNFVAVPASTVLLVDAYLWTGNESEIPLGAYTNALNQTGVSYDVWSTSARGFPIFNNLRSYQIVMWRLNDSFYTTDFIPSAQQNAIQQYLNAGGAFFMASMDILTRMLDNGGSQFVTNVFHVQRFGRNPDPFSYCQGPDCDEDVQVPVTRGVANDLIGDGILTSLDYSSYPVLDLGFDVLGPDFGDTFGVATNATAFLLEDVSGKPCGMRFPRTGQDSTGRVVFVSFPLDAIPESGPEPNNRAAFLRRAFQFLAPGLNGLGTIALDQDSYHLPDLITIEVADSDLAGSPYATVQVYSTTAPTPVIVTNRETTRPGLFRGFIPVVAPTNASSSRWLRATNGDTIYAEYYDASGQSVLTALATVDTVLAIISAVSVDPEYQDATISWETSEPADALVQFGESAFLGRTAYVAGFGTSHEVRLSGLVPDRLYYYKVVSRDPAGNTTVDDNTIHTFRTLQPLKPPFNDNLQNGATNWSVFDGDVETQFSWRVGSPQNGHVANTPSGDGSAWASNLLGDPADYIDTHLISPAIDLTGGNVAHLRFWNAYKFGEDGFEIVNGGELLIYTNSVSDPATLAVYLDQNSGWEMEDIELTPYLGNVIFLEWHHLLFSISPDPPIERPGWAIDDISVTVSNVPPCTICVSNNLAQGRVSISGAVNRASQGYLNCFTNLPPGRYVITWLSLPYYQAPPARTNVVAENEVLLLSGNYTFPDANRNGMSDTWEQQYFGVVATNRTCTTDTDGDGFPDCAEFAAGTNPTNAVSYLRLYPPVTQPNNKLLFQWTSVAGHIYQVQGYSFPLRSWIPLHDGWIRATAAITSKSVSAPDPDEPYLFRVESRP